MSSRARGAVVAAALIAALTLTACGGAAETAEPPADGRAGSARTVTTVDGARLLIPDGKPAVVFFFSVSCGSCLAGGQSLAEARAQAADKADFLLVDLDPTEPKDVIDAFRARVGDKTLPAVSQGAAALAQAWQVAALSMVVVVDAAGTVTYRAIDPTAADILTAVEQARAR